MKSKKSNLKRRKRTRKNQKGGNPFTYFETHFEYIEPAEKIEKYYDEYNDNDKATVVIHKSLTMDERMDDAGEPTFLEIIYKGDTSEGRDNIHETTKDIMVDKLNYKVSDYRITIIYKNKVFTYIVRKLNDNTDFYVYVSTDQSLHFKNFKTIEEFFEFLGIPESGYTLHIRQEETSYPGLLWKKPAVRGLDFSVGRGDRVVNPMFNESY